MKRIALIILALLSIGVTQADGTFATVVHCSDVGDYHERYVIGIFKDLSHVEDDARLATIRIDSLSGNQGTPTGLFVNSFNEDSDLRIYEGPDFKLEAVDKDNYTYFSTEPVLSAMTLKKSDIVIDMYCDFDLAGPMN